MLYEKVHLTQTNKTACRLSHQKASHYAI